MATAALHCPPPAQSHSSASDEVGCIQKESCPSPPLSSDGDKDKTQLFCSLCKIAVNSPSQLQAHNGGTKHKAILEACSGLGPIRAYPRLSFSSSLVANTKERTFHCEICNVRVNSEPQLKQHISSRRHRDGLAGKSNPLINRHKNLSSAQLMSALSFYKNLPKTFPAGLLPNTLAVAKVMAATSSNHIAVHSLGPSLYPYLPMSRTTQFNESLQRPTFRSISFSHGPVLYSPY